MFKYPKLSLSILLICTFQAVIAGVISDVSDELALDVQEMSDNQDFDTFVAKCNLRSGCYQGRHYYFELGTKRTRDDAVQYCNALNMKLVSIENCGQDNFITNLLKSQPTCAGHNYWLSARQNGDNDWTWGNGAALTYTNWKLNEPSTKANQYCMALRSGYLQWSAMICNNKYYFICESNNPC